MLVASMWSVITARLDDKGSRRESARTFTEVEKCHARHHFTAVDCHTVAKWQCLQRNRKGTFSFPYYNCCSKAKGLMHSADFFPLLFLKEPLFPQISLTMSKLLLVYVWKRHHRGETTSLKHSSQMGMKQSSIPRIWVTFFFLSWYFEL